MKKNNLQQYRLLIPVLAALAMGLAPRPAEAKLFELYGSMRAGGITGKGFSDLNQMDCVLTTVSANPLGDCTRTIAFSNFSCRVWCKRGSLVFWIYAFPKSFINDLIQFQERKPCTDSLQHSLLGVVFGVHKA